MMRSSIILALLSLLLLSATPATARQDGGAVRHDAKLVVHAAAQGLGGMLEKEPDRDRQFRIIRDFVRPVRFFADHSGYFFAVDSTGISVANGLQPQLEGKNIWDLKDVSGAYLVRNMIELAKSGGGFIEYHWEKPGVEGTHLKLGYVELIPGTDILLGSGVYFPEPW